LEYEIGSAIFKALSEPARLRILEMLSHGEQCACELLEGLSISQPTLSHHMRVLTDCGLVSGRKEGTWMYYSIVRERVDWLHRWIDTLMGEKQSGNRPFSKVRC
jgi:ArsR family transcriptional regulator, arsenate/arsenite/antimonite-responsive transcriptional repressor